MKRPLRLYYPGSISLVGLLLFLGHMYLNWPEPQTPEYFRFFLPTDDQPKNGLPRYSKYALLDELKKKHVVQVEIDEPERWGYKAKKIALIRREIERITFTHESHTVLKVVLGSESDYSDIVGLMRFMRYYRVKRYALVDDCFYIFGNEPPEVFRDRITRDK